MLGFLVFGAPALALSYVAAARGKSRWFALWGALSYLGMLIGLIMLVATPSKAIPRD